MARGKEGSQNLQKRQTLLYYSLLLQSVTKSLRTTDIHLFMKALAMRKPLLLGSIFQHGHTRAQASPCMLMGVNHIQTSTPSQTSEEVTWPAVAYFTGKS